MRVDVLRVPPVSLNLSDNIDFGETTLRGVSLAVDEEARNRMGAAAEVTQLPKSAAAEMVPFLIMMLDQDRVSGGVGVDLAAAFSSGLATQDDAVRAANMARIGEADLACQVAAQDALAAIGVDALPALVEALRHPSTNRRIGAAKALGAIGAAAESAHAALQAVTNPEDLVRRAAGEALKKAKARRWF